jgi:hypothetical protein
LQDCGEERFLHVLRAVFMGLAWDDTSVHLPDQLPDCVVQMFLPCFFILLWAVVLKRKLKTFDELLVGKNVLLLKILLSPFLVAFPEQGVIDVSDFYTTIERNVGRKQNNYIK